MAVDPAEAHPIQSLPPWSAEKRIAYLEIHLAMLWDQVWWMNLPPEQRKMYEAQGFTAPIQKFYGRV